MGTTARWFGPGAVAAVAVAAVVAVTAWLGHQAGHPIPLGSPEIRPGDTVAWQPLPATRPSIPTTTVPASPDPSAAESAPPCRTADLHTGSDVGGAMGTTYFTIRFVSSGRPCALSGVPRVDAYTVDGRVLPGEIQEAPDGYGRHPVLVTASAAAVVQVTWPSACFGATRSGRIEVTLPGDTTPLTFDGLELSSRCAPDGPPTPLTHVGVTPIQPARSRPAVVETAYDAIAVGPPLGRITAAPGAEVDFTVTLTAPHDIPLDPCPDYTIGQYDVGRVASWALNCAQVPYRLPDGTPYLPAGKPVRFAMRTTAPQQTIDKFLWMLDLPPDSFVGTSGILVVSAGPGRSPARR
jgi:hypothetical protein